MDKNKKLGILLGVLAVVCIATIAVSRHEVKKEQIKSSDETILAIPTDTVSSISWEYGDKSLAFHRIDGNVNASAANSKASATELSAADGNADSGKASAADKSSAGSSTAADGDTSGKNADTDASDAVWVNDEDADFPVDTDKINELLSIFEDFGVSFIIESPESLSDYGLDKPECTVSFTADGTDYKFMLGGFSTMDQERYVSIDDGNVYLVQTDPLDSFDRELKDFIKADEIPEMETAEKLSFGGSLLSDSTGTYEISYDADSSAAYSDEDVYYYEGTRPLDSESVNSYLKKLGNIDLTDCADYTFTEDSLSDHGLDTPLLTAQICYNVLDEDGKATGEIGTLSFAVGSPDAKKSAANVSNSEAADNSSAAISDADTADSSDEELTAASAGKSGTIASEDTDSDDTAGTTADNSGISASADNSSADAEKISENAYLRFAGSSLVYKLSAEDYESITDAGLGAFVKKQVLPVSFDDVDSIDVSLDGNTYTFTGEKKLTGGRDWKYNDESIDIADVQSAIEHAAADDYTTDAASLKKEISLTFHTTSGKHRDITTDIYRYNGSHCLIVTDGQSGALLPRSDAVDIIEAIYAIVLG